MVKIALSALCFILLSITLQSQSKSELKIRQHLTQGDTSKALKKLNQSLAKNPNDALLYKLRAEVKINRKDFDAAMTDLKSYCALNSYCEDGQFLMGSMLYKMGDYANCISHLDQTKGSKYEASAMVFKGLAYMWLYQYAHAEQVFSEAIDKFPQSKDLCYNGAILAYRMEKFDLAERYIQQFLALSPKDFDGLLSKALIYTKQKKYIESNLILRDLLKEKNDHASALYSIAVNYYHLNEYDLACNYFRQARDLGHEAAQLSLKKYCRGR